MNNNYSQIKAFLAIFKASLKASSRNPSAIIFGFVFPLIFILIFGFLGNGVGKPSVVFTENTDTSSVFYKALVESNTLDIQENYDYTNLDNDIDQGRLDGVIELKVEKKENCEANCEKLLINLRASGASQNAPILISVLEGFTNKLNSPLLSEEERVANLGFTVEEGREFKTIDFILPGQLGFALLSTGIFGTAFVFVNLRDTLVLKRFFATPIRKINIILGEGLSRVLISSIQSSTLILFGTFFLGYTLVNGFLTFLQMFFLIILGLIVFMGVGFIISGVSKNEDNVPPLANLFTLPQFLLSGTFFPTEAFPKVLEVIANFLPLTHLNNAMRAIAFEGLTIFQVLPDIGILLAWGVVIYIIAIKTFRWE